LKKHILLSFTSAIFLALPYVSNLPVFSLFLGFIPLFIIEDDFLKQKTIYKPLSFFNYAYLTFALWNLLTLWWTVNSSLVSIIPPLLLNSFFMAIVFLVFHIAHRNLPPKFAFSTLLFFWIAFEYVHHNWFLSFPWLTLGNAFTNNLNMVQWYEFTGVLGGSFWILLVNLLIFRMYRLVVKFKTFQAILRESIALLLIIALPILLSQKIKKNFHESGKNIKVAVIQPNIDSYTEKYNAQLQLKNFDKSVQLIKQASDCDYIIAPETTIPRDLEIIWEENFYASKSITSLREILKTKPNTKLVFGVNSFQKTSEKEKNIATVRFDKHSNSYYKSYSTAIQIDTSTKVQKYHKSKLVLGVEKMPFANLFPWLDNLMVDFGGIVGSLATDSNRTVFNSENGKYIAGVPICYETLYGEFVAEFVKNGATHLFVITNDGWWGDTPGYRQHAKLSQLRAIETRRSIARSANTGISSFINPYGEILKKSQYNQEILLESSISLNSGITYYTKNGDVIGRIALFFSGLFLLYLVVQIISKQNKD